MPPSPGGQPLAIGSLSSREIASVPRGGEKSSRSGVKPISTLAPCSPTQRLLRLSTYADALRSRRRHPGQAHGPAATDRAGSRGGLEWRPSFGKLVHACRRSADKHIEGGELQLILLDERVRAPTPNTSGGRPAGRSRCPGLEQRASSWIACGGRAPQGLGQLERRLPLGVDRARHVAPSDAPPCRAGAERRG